MEIQGSLCIGSQEEANNPDLAKITTIDGNLEIGKDVQVTLPALTEVSGNVTADECATVTLPALTKVSGDVIAYNRATLTLPALTEVSGDVNASRDFTRLRDRTTDEIVKAYQDPTVTLRALTKVAGYVWAYNCILTLPALAKVSGKVKASLFATLTLPALTEVSGGVEVDKQATLTLPALRKAGYVYAWFGATLTLPALTEVSLNVTADEDATLTLPVLTKCGQVTALEGATLALPALTECSFVSAHTALALETEDILLAACDSWLVGEACSDYLFAELATRKNVEYQIGYYRVPRELFDRVRSRQMTPSEVFALANMEQRRVVYSRLDKTKMAQLPSCVLDEVSDDGYGYPMRLIEIEIEGFDGPFRYLVCRSPSTGREYWLETRQTTCRAAKAVSFGMPEDFTFDVEW